MDLDFDQTKSALDRFRGEETETFSTFIAPGEHLPKKPAKVILCHIEITSQMVTVGETDAERFVRPREKRRFLEFGDGTATPWRIPEETFEGGTWVVADSELKISSGARAVHFVSARPLPSAERVYEVIRVERDGTRLPKASYQSDRRLLRGDRIRVDGHFWSVDQAEDAEDGPPWVRVLRRLP